MKYNKISSEYYSDQFGKEITCYKTKKYDILQWNNGQHYSRIKEMLEHGFETDRGDISGMPRNGYCSYLLISK
jgi:hypothetical protein